MLDSGLATALTLSKALQSPNSFMRAAAAEALWKTNDQRAVPALRDALRDKDETVRRAAALGLGALAWQPAGLEELISWEVAMNRWDEVLARGDLALEAIVFAARHSGPDSQAKAIECVVSLKSMRAMLQLVPLLGSPHSVVRRATAAALKSLEWMPVNDDQAMRQAIELDEWNTVAAFGAKAIPFLIASLKSSHAAPQRHGIIAAALQTITDPEGVTQLLKLCADGEVAGAAVAALDALLRQNVENIRSEVLRSILRLTNVIQFKFKHDASENRLVRSGIELVDLTSVKNRAESELSRRPQSPEAMAVSEAEAA
jgi:hypothetical protein